MKVILTGATGFIGKEVLQQCLANASITSVTVLSRRPLPVSAIPSDPKKLRVVVMDDFISYSDSVLQDLAGAEACIWMVGSKSRTADENARKVDLEYTLAAALAFVTHLAPQLDKQKKKFRFVFCSGVMTVRDQQQKLWYLESARLLRGEVENRLIAFQDQHQSAWETYIVRPALVLSEQDSMLRKLLGRLIGYVMINDLAATMISATLNGSETLIVENDALKGRSSISRSGESGETGS